MKVISYSLFGESNYTERNRFEFDKYLLGVYLNARMNMLVYPGWRMWVSIDSEISIKYLDYFNDLAELLNVSRIPIAQNPKLCEGMLWRIGLVIGQDNLEYVICRDLDALTSYREAQAVNEWLASGKGFHCIHDNPAHSGLMGGMIGIKKQAWNEKLSDISLSNYDLSEHGSDQNLLNKRILPKIQNDLLISKNPPRKTDNPLWESDLCSFFIGAAGCNEMETLRFFNRFDYDEKYVEFEKKHSQICYWRR